MPKNILFVQGAGAETHAASRPLVDRFSTQLGSDYAIHFPEMPGADHPDSARWIDVVASALAELGDGTIAVGHSFGGTILASLISERHDLPALAGLITVAAPYFGKGGWQFDAVGMSDRIAGHFPSVLPVLLLHGTSDRVVPVTHVELFARAIPQADVRRIAGADHMLNGDLGAVVEAVKELG